LRGDCVVIDVEDGMVIAVEDYRVAAAEHCLALDHVATFMTQTHITRLDI
jgi:hypothetical protein